MYKFPPSCLFAFSSQSSHFQTQQHPYTIKGQLLEEFDSKSRKRTKTYEMKRSFLSKRKKKAKKTPKPPIVLKLKPFEEDVIKFLETIKFRDTKRTIFKTIWQKT